MKDDQIKNNSDRTGEEISSGAQGPVPQGENQLIDEKGEEYLRESGKIEDYPDAADAQQKNETNNEAN